MKLYPRAVANQRPSSRQFQILLVIVVTFLVLLNVVRLPDLLAHWMGYSGRLALFAVDMTFNYTPTQVYALLSAYGNEGRHAYAAMLILFDIVFPFLYGSFLSVGLRLVVQRTRLSLRLQRIVGGIPYVASTADWLENVCILAMLFSYPSQLTAIASIANLLTMTKFLVAAICLSGLLLGGLVLLVQRIFFPRKARLEGRPQ
jgi:hypothetical protein